MESIKNIFKSEESFYLFLSKFRVEIFLLIFAILVGLFFQWNIVEILLLVIFVAVLLFPTPSRYLAWPAFLFLMFVPVLMAFERKEQAEEFAIYAYYFLVMVVIRGIIEIRGQKEEKS